VIRGYCRLFPELYEEITMREYENIRNVQIAQMQDRIKISDLKSEAHSERSKADKAFLDSLLREKKCGYA